MSNIPLDIERLCVEVAISEFVFVWPTLPTKQVPALLRVCRRFKEWCYPHFYRSIAFSPDGASAGLPLLRRTLVESPELALLVRDVILPRTDRSTLGDIVDILPLCLNLTGFLFWHDQYLRLDLSNHKALRRLSYFPSLFPFTSHDDPLPQNFLQLTHLDLIHAGDRLNLFSSLASLTSLTHLFTELLGLNYLTLIDAFPPSLRVCILFQESPALSTARMIASGEVNKRIVLACSHPPDLSVPYILRHFDDFPRDWGRFGSGQTHWDEAELIIKDRTSDIATSAISTVQQRGGS